MVNKDGFMYLHFKNVRIIKTPANIGVFVSLSWRYEMNRGVGQNTLLF
jgi:hypothetical protein